MGMGWRLGLLLAGWVGGRKRGRVKMGEEGGGRMLWWFISRGVYSILFYFILFLLVYVWVGGIRWTVYLLLTFAGNI